MKKVFLPLSIIILFSVCAFLLIHPFNWSLPLTTSLILILNWGIILAATYFGRQGVIILGAGSLLIYLVHSWRSAQGSGLPFLLLIGTISIFYAYSLKISGLSRRLNTELDNIEEENNVLAVEMEHLSRQNSSLKEKLHRYATLKDLTETLSTTLSLDEIISLITNEAFSIIGKSEAALLYLVDKERQRLSLAGTKLKSALTEVKHKNGDIFDQWVFKQRQRLIIEDTRKDFRFTQESTAPYARDVRSLISAPLISQNKLLGILRLDSPSSNSYNTDDLRLLDILSDLAAVAIENTLLYQRMQSLAMTDGLTGLFVHRYFQERFDEEISRALWTNSQFAFLMLDIDDFKSYNDRYGHIAGDIVLQQIAKLITNTVNPGDIVGRYGGEEFGVLLVNTSPAEAKKTAERIRARIEERRFMLRRQMTQVHVSGGISFFPTDSKVKEGLIQQADQALYKAKKKGKNRICTP